jgi:hypothetical protein
MSPALVTIATFSSSWEAALAQNALLAESIPAFLSREAIAAISEEANPEVAIGLLVARQDVQPALAVLNRLCPASL